MNNQNQNSRQINFRKAANEALREEMQRDDRVFLLGEDIGLFGGAFRVTYGLQKEFGEERVRDTPISEAAILGAALGAAMTGMRPIAEIMYNDFITIGMDQLVNQIAKMRYMSGGKFNIPLVIRTTIGSGVSGAAQHSQNLHALFMHIPGLQLVVPSTPYNVKGLLKTAIRNDNPVIFIEHQLLYITKGFIPKKEYTIPFGKADIKRKGKDVTVIATLNMVYKAIEAGKLLEKIGISIEIIDLQTLVPYDKNTVIESVKKTSKLVIVSEGCKTGGEGAEIAAMIAEDAFEYLKAPIKRVAAYDVPIPFNPNLEKYVIPDINDIVTAIKDLVRK